MKQTEVGFSYFIRKFSNISSEFWTKGQLTYKDKHCALGHCGVYDYTLNPEAKALVSLFRKKRRYITEDSVVTEVNDLSNGRLGATPKFNILRELQFRRIMQEKFAEKILSDIQVHVDVEEVLA